MIRRFGRRSVLRAGYAGVIGVLILSLMEAYRIQVNVAQQQVEIFRHYVDEEAALTSLRRNLWLAGNYVRDYFIRNTPDQGSLLQEQLEMLRAEDQQNLNHLARISPWSAEFRKLRRSLDDFWAVLEPVPNTMRHATSGEQFDFIQRQIVPRRGELYSALVALSDADRQRLEDNEKRFADARNSAAGRLLLMLGLGVLLSVLVAVVSIRHSENLERKAEGHYAEVEHARGELQQLSARLLEVEEEGRRRLARELHDEVGQSLALLQIEVSHAQAVAHGQPQALTERLRRARTLAEKTLQSVRNISVLLRPTLLDDLGLVPALQFQIEDFLRRSGIACEFVEEHVSEYLPDAVKTCVYRVVQEALHNCEKHAGATKVQVSVRESAELLLVEVQDNGQGFEASEKGRPSKIRGLGLLGMRERAANVGGSLLIDSSPGHGTRIILRIPVHPTEPSAPAPDSSEKVIA